MTCERQNEPMGSQGRVAIDGYPPKAPTDPDVRTLAHPAPRYERFATLDKPNVLL